MSIKDITSKLRTLFHQNHSEIPDQAIRDLIRSLEEAETKKCFSCEEVFAVVDQYAEIEIRGEDAAKLMPLLRQHLDGCHDCCEEYEALLDVLQNSNPA
jgi:hypothetical protein